MSQRDLSDKPRCALGRPMRAAIRKGAKFWGVLGQLANANPFLHDHSIALDIAMIERMQATCELDVVGCRKGLSRSLPEG